MRKHFSIRNILIIVTLITLSIPALTIYYLRLYESELVSRTESELIAQGAFIGSAYKLEAVRRIKNFKNYGLNAPEALPTDTYYNPIEPRIDLYSDPILPPRPDVSQNEIKADPEAIKIGETLMPLLIEAQKTTLVGIRVLDYHGIVIAGRDELGMSFAHIDEVATALKGAYSPALRQRISDSPTPPLTSISRRTSIRLFAAFPIIHESRILGVIYLSRTPESIGKNIYRNAEKILWGALIVLGLAMTAGFATSYLITRPLNSLMEQARLVLKNKPPSILKGPAPEELKQLSEGLINMATTVNKRSEYVKDFAMRVSHEFKTPISSILGTTELLSEHISSMTAAEKDKFLGMIANNAQRLERLIQRLMELAKADMLNPDDSKCSIGEALEKLKSRFYDTGCVIEHDRIESEEQAAIAPELMDAVLENLVKNSIAHGASRVKISLARIHGNISIKISDNGSGISEANLPHVFTPFFTTKRHDGGTGLGLAITKSIIEAHGGSIAATSSSAGAEFSITLPLHKVG